MAEFLNENEFALGVNGLTIVDADGNILYSLPIAEGLEGQSLVVAANGSLVFGEGAANVAEFGFAGNSYLTSTYVTNTVFQLYVANTNPRFDRYLEVANVSSVTGDYVTNTVFQAALANTNYQITVTQNDIEFNLANTNAYIASVSASQTQYLQVANAVATYFPLTGGTVTGNTEFTGNLQVDGDLIVIGNTVTFTANNLSISDNFIYLNTGGGNLNIDMGWSGGYNDGTGYSHAGILRDADDQRFKLFNKYDPEPSANININVGHPSFEYADLQIDDLYANNVYADNLVTNTAFQSALANTNAYIASTTLIVYDVANTQVFPTP